ncbi:MAG: hypothetical protein ACYTXA_26200 [Nostoc sp.]
MGGAERNPTDYQDVGFGKASTQPTIFLQLELKRLSALDVGWVERSATQLIIRMLALAKPPPNLQFFCN